LRVRLERGGRLRQHSGYDHDRVSHHFQYLHDSLLVRHLKYRQVPLFKGIIVSWGIAFFEYCFQVPANRVGSYELSAVQLKRIQEVITLIVFSVFSVLYLDDQIRWNYIVGFALIVAAVFVIFKKW
jgi:uncharacterized protein (DUF486 family)